MNIFSVLDESDNEEVQPNTKAAPAAAKNVPATGKPVKPAGKDTQAANATKPKAATNEKPKPVGDKPKSTTADAVEGDVAKDDNRGGRARGKEYRERGGRGGRGGAEGAADGERRPKRDFERRSGTGRGREVSKGGRGAFGFGNPAQDAQDAEKDPNSAEAAIEPVEGAEESAEPEVVAEPEPVTYSLDEFLEKRNEARKALLANKTKERVVDQSSLAGLSRKEDEGETTYMPVKASKVDVSKKDQRSTGYCTPVSFGKPSYTGCITPLKKEHAVPKPPNSDESMDKKRVKCSQINVPEVDIIVEKLKAFKAIENVSMEDHWLAARLDLGDIECDAFLEAVSRTNLNTVLSAADITSRLRRDHLAIVESQEEHWAAARLELEDEDYEAFFSATTMNNNSPVSEFDPAVWLRFDLECITSAEIFGLICLLEPYLDKRPAFSFRAPLSKFESYMFNFKSEESMWAAANTLQTARAFDNLCYMRAGDKRVVHSCYVLPEPNTTLLYTYRGYYCWLFDKCFGCGGERTLKEV